MEENTIEVQTDMFGDAFLIDACQTDGSDNRLSTLDYMKEEIATCGYGDVFCGLKTGVYKVTSQYDDYPIFERVE